MIVPLSAVLSKSVSTRSAHGRCVRLLLVLVACLGASTARAQTATLAELSAAALDISLQVQRATPRTGTVIMLGSTLHDAVLRDIRVQIDDRAPVLYQFSEDEAHALNSGALQFLCELPADAAGSHRLRAEFRARADTGKPHASLIAAQTDRSFDTSSAPATLVLNAQAGSIVSAASFDLQSFAGDPLPHEAAFLLAGARPFPAAVLFAASGSADPARAQLARAALGLQADASEASPVLVHYNAAVAGAGDAKSDHADAALQQIGDAEAQDPLGQAARDLANLTLGYRALQSGRVEQAAENFKRVRSPGPYSSSAMLGLGWSYLVPPTEQPAAIPISLHPASADELAMTRRQTPFRYLQAVVDGKRADDLRRALIPWSELIGRDPLDPAVQEGMLVIPYALDHLGAHAEAQDYYQRAVERLGVARQTLARANSAVADGKVFAELDERDADLGSGWPRLLVERHADEAAVPLRTLIEDPQVAATLHDYRQLQDMDRALAADRLRVATANDALCASIDTLRARIADARRVAMNKARAALDAELQAREHQTNAYLAEAEFALARIDDRLPHGVSAP